MAHIGEIDAATRFGIREHLVGLLGPCRILHLGAGNTGLLTELLLAGCDAWATGVGLVGGHSRVVSAGEGGRFDAVVAEVPPDAVAEAWLAEALGGVAALERLAVHAPGRSRPQIEAMLFADGWRRHPGDLTVARYPSLSDAAMPVLAVYERIPEAARARWRVVDLAADRALHMDMLREGGCRADAHIARYALAANYVRPGDTVLDCACGLGYGTAVMAALSRGAAFMGVDCDADTVEYARANYAVPGVSFHRGDAAALDGIPDASVDLVVSMETIEHVEDWKAAVTAFRRVLKPDGRLIASVPDVWADETGSDPNPYHYHVFDWAKFSEGLMERFLVEARYAQTAPGGFKLQQAPRRLIRVALDARGEAEWIVAVASVNPHEDGAERRREFRHPAFADCLAASGAAVVDFGGGYDNPFLYRPLVQMGERISDPERLFRFANFTLGSARPDSADAGAALCVLGYHLLELRHLEGAAEVRTRISAYRATTEETVNPHVARWRISLAFVAGRLAELAGEADEALAWFEAAATSDWGRFSPMLATKAVAADFHAGALRLARGEEVAARACFVRGLRNALAAVGCGASAIVGDPETPIPFGLAEIAEVADMGAQCANAVHGLPVRARDPGAFWRQIDVKRFGLASWNRELEQANAALQAMLHRRAVG